MFQTRPGAAILCGSVDEADQQAPQKGIRMAPFASISSSLIRELGKPGSTPSTRADQTTGVEFPYEFCFRAKPHCSQLAGLGVRSKRILGIKNINVYALGWYIDGTAAQKALGHKFKHADPETLAKDQALFDSLISDNQIEKSLRMVITFGGLKRETFVEALEERLAPRLKKAGQSELVDTFKHQFDGASFTKGTEILFTQSGEQFITSIGGKEVGRISSPTLSSAMWDIYLGPDPVSPDAKASLGNTLAAAIHK